MTERAKRGIAMLGVRVHGARIDPQDARKGLATHVRLGLILSALPSAACPPLRLHCPIVSVLSRASWPMGCPIGWLGRTVRIGCPGASWPSCWQSRNRSTGRMDEMDVVGWDGWMGRNGLEWDSYQPVSGASPPAVHAIHAMHMQNSKGSQEGCM